MQKAGFLITRLFNNRCPQLTLLKPCQQQLKKVTVPTTIVSGMKENENGATFAPSVRQSYNSQSFYEAMTLFVKTCFTNAHVQPSGSDNVSENPADLLIFNCFALSAERVSV